VWSTRFYTLVVMAGIATGLCSVWSTRWGRRASTVFCVGYELKKQRHPYSTAWHNQMAAPRLVKLTLCLI